MIGIAKAALLLLVFLTGLLLISCRYVDQVDTSAVNKAIQTDPRMKELDSFCSQIPVPKSFQFVSKSDMDDQKITYTVNYWSDGERDEAIPLWSKYFKEKGWDEIRREINSSTLIIEFKKEQYRVGLEARSVGVRINRMIYCELLK